MKCWIAAFDSIPQINTLRCNSVAILRVRGMSRTLWCVSKGLAAAPPAMDCSTGVSICFGVTRAGRRSNFWGLIKWHQYRNIIILVHYFLLRGVIHSGDRNNIPPPYIPDTRRILSKQQRGQLCTRLRFCSFMQYFRASIASRTYDAKPFREISWSSAKPLEHFPTSFRRFDQVELFSSATSFTWRLPYIEDQMKYRGTGIYFSAPLGADNFHPLLL